MVGGAVRFIHFSLLSHTRIWENRAFFFFLFADTSRGDNGCVATLPVRSWLGCTHLFFCPLVVGHAATTTSTTDSKPTRADNAGHTPKPKAATRCVATHTRPPQTRRVRAPVVVVWSLGPGTLIPDGSRQLMLPILQISAQTLPSLPHNACMYSGLHRCTDIIPSGSLAALSELRG